MAKEAEYTAIVRMGRGVISTANTARDGTGTIADVFVAGANGSRIESIEVIAQGATTAGMVRLYLHNGTDWELWREIQVDAITPTATVAAFYKKMLMDDPLLLPTGWKLGAAPHAGETFNVHANGGDF